MKNQLQIKNPLLFCLILALTTSTWAQEWQNGLWTENQAENWCFTHLNGFNFSTGEPVAFTGVQMSALEGSTTISDADGNLLFYAGGDGSAQIWNQNHVVALNGGGLEGGGGTSTQTGVFVERPGNPNILYFFGITITSGLRYTEIDLTLDGGLGGITNIKDIELDAAAESEKITAVYHADGEQIWILVHRSGGNEFVAYRISESGIHAPVVSAVGSSYPDFDPEEQTDALYYGGGAGQLKFSPDGSKIAATIFGSDNKGVEIFDFDNATGVVSNPIYIDVPYSAYGVEFSPNSQILYVASPDTYFNGSLHQFDLSLPTEADIQASDVLLMQLADDFTHTFHSMQLAPNGRLYIMDHLGNSLSAINYPNNLGADCGYEQDAIEISNFNGLGLPNFNQSYFESGVTFNDNGCPGEEITFSLVRIPDVTSVAWDFGDPDSGSDNNSTQPVHAFSGPGSYTVTATVTSNNATQIVTAQVEIIESPEAVSPGNVYACSAAGTPTIFDLTLQENTVLNGQDPNEVEILFFNTENDAESNQNAIANPENYTSAGETIYVRATNSNGCFEVASFEIEVIDAPQSEQLADVEVCDTGVLDGITVFDLQIHEDEILGNQPNVEINYFLTEEDAENNVNSISNPESFSNSENPQDIYVRINNELSPECYAISTFEIAVSEALFPTAALEIQGCSSFNLTSIENNFEENTSLTFYSTEEDALEASNPISNFENYSTNEDETLYVRMENEEGCSTVGQLQLYAIDCDIPEGISPNSDGMNDAFDLASINETYGAQLIKMYNRNGILVFEKSNYTNEWSGQDMNGNQLPTGTYFYVLRLENEHPQYGNMIKKWVYLQR